MKFTVSFLDDASYDSVYFVHGAHVPGRLPIRLADEPKGDEPGQFDRATAERIAAQLERPERPNRIISIDPVE